MLQTVLDLMRVRSDEEMGVQNCWEFKGCERLPEGIKISECGVCTAYTYSQTDGMNHGKNGGRICWAIAGTLSGGEPTGSFVPKVIICMNCDFYKKVQEEEGKDFKFAVECGLQP